MKTGFSFRLLACLEQHLGGGKYKNIIMKPRESEVMKLRDEARSAIRTEKPLLDHISSISQIIHSRVLTLEPIAAPWVDKEVQIPVDKSILGSVLVKYLCDELIRPKYEGTRFRLVVGKAQRPNVGIDSRQFQSWVDITTRGMAGIADNRVDITRLNADLNPIMSLDTIDGLQQCPSTPDTYYAWGPQSISLSYAFGSTATDDFEKKELQKDLLGWISNVLSLPNCVQTDELFSAITAFLRMGYHPPAVDLLYQILQVQVHQDNGMDCLSEEEKRNVEHFLKNWGVDRTEIFNLPPLPTKVSDKELLKNAEYFLKGNEKEIPAGFDLKNLPINIKEKKKK